MDVIRRDGVQGEFFIALDPCFIHIDMTADSIHKQAREISSDLVRVQIEAIEAANS